jgi:hypothetical protein
VKRSAARWFAAGRAAAAISRSWVMDLKGVEILRAGTPVGQRFEEFLVRKATPEELRRAAAARVGLEERRLREEIAAAKAELEELRQRNRAPAAKPMTRQEAGAKLDDLTHARMARNGWGYAQAFKAVCAEYANEELVKIYGGRSAARAETSSEYDGRAFWGRESGGVA